jgi:hypothetical protein
MMQDFHNWFHTQQHVSEHVGIHLTKSFDQRHYPKLALPSGIRPT